VTTFAELGLSKPILDALSHLGYERPTPIQEQTIPACSRQGRDRAGPDGTGKTAAFGCRCSSTSIRTSPEVQAIVMTPTRELCIQVTPGAARLRTEPRDRRGGRFRRRLDPRPGLAPQPGGQVVVGTVGRVLDMISRHHLMLDQARFVVLDEADEMLDLGFLEDVETILSRCPAGRQTALFSATIPAEIHGLAEKFMYDPVNVKVKAATLTIDTVDHYYVEAPDGEKPDALTRVLKAERPEQAIVFVRTKIGVDRLARKAERRRRAGQGAARRHVAGHPRWC